MNACDALVALELPAATRVDRRVPKALLRVHGAPTAADKRRIAEGIELIQWVAVLKPTTVGVASYRDETREYLEIAVLRVVLRGEAKSDRLIELLHRAIPYPVFALAERDDRLSLSVAHKRWSQGQAGKTVLEGEPSTVDAPQRGDPYGTSFTAALALGRQPRASLYALYQGWLDTLLALEAARLSGGFTILPTEERRTQRRDALQDAARLDAEILRLRASATREKQMARRVALNLQLKRVESERNAVLTRL